MNLFRESISGADGGRLVGIPCWAIKKGKGVVIGHGNGGSLVGGEVTTNINSLFLSQC